MTFYNRDYISQIQEQMTALGDQTRSKEIERETLYKELSVEIHFIINQFNQIATSIDEKMIESGSLKKQCNNQTRSTEISKEDLLKESDISIKQQNNLGYSYQNLKQRLDILLQRELQLKQKILSFIRKDEELQQNIQMFIQKESQFKKKDSIIHELQKKLEEEKTKYKNKLEAEINQNCKHHKSKLQSQYNKKIQQAKLQYEQKIQQNIRKSQRIISILRQEKQKTINLLHQQLQKIQKNFQQKYKMKGFKSPQKIRKVNNLDDAPKIKCDTDEKGKAQTEGKINSTNQKITDLRNIAKKLQVQLGKIKVQKVNLVSKIESLENEVSQQAKKISQKQNQLANIQKESNRICQQLQQKNENSQNFERKIKSLEAKIANLTEELKRSKKLSQQTKEMMSKNARHLQKLLEDSKKEYLEAKKSYINLNLQFESVKKEIKQKEIRIQSMERQLERTKNYNQILVSENKTLNEKIQKIGQNSVIQKKSSKVIEQVRLDSNGPKDILLKKSQQKYSPKHSRSIGDFFKSETQLPQQVIEEGVTRLNSSRLNNLSEKSLENEININELGRENIPIKSSNNQTENLYIFNSFETTFSPLVHPVYQVRQRTEAYPAFNSSVNQAPHILSWNPQSPIHQIESVYSSIRERANQQNNHQLRSEELIQKMNSLSQQKKKKQSSLEQNGITNIILDQSFQKEPSPKKQHEIKVPKLKPFSRYTSQQSNNLKGSSSPQEEERFLNLSFEGSSYYDRSSFLNKKTNISSNRPEGLKGSLNLPKQSKPQVRRTNKFTY